MSRLNLWPARAVVAAAISLCAAACQRNEAPTPGVAGGTANAPSAAGSAPVVVPEAKDTQVGRGKSPGQAGETTEGTTGGGGAASAPSSAPDPNRPGMPAIPPADAPGAGATAPPASAPASR